MESKYTMYTGPSMNPIFWSGDGLEVVPYEGAKVRVGDVVVYPHPEQGNEVVHRVIEVTPEGVHTRGDNNNKIDPYLVFIEDIRGRVATVRHESASHKVRRGYPGLLLHRYFLVRRRARIFARCHLVPAYHRFADTGLFYGWHRPFLKTKLVTFHRKDGPELLLMRGKRTIGRLAPGAHAWIIRFPYRLFIDREKLPR